MFKIEEMTNARKANELKHLNQMSSRFDFQKYKKNGKQLFVFRDYFHVPLCSDDFS